MIPKIQRSIRQALHENPDGMTSSELAQVVPVHLSNIRRALRAMPDTYVDRWKPARHGSYEKVWCAVYVPPDCPHPKDRQFKGGRGLPPRTRWASTGAPAWTV